MSQAELFADIVPTPSMLEGEGFVTQCAECGLLVASGIQPKKPQPLGKCPGCGCERWWGQDLPVGPFHQLAVELKAAIEAIEAGLDGPADSPLVEVFAHDWRRLLELAKAVSL